MIAGMHISNSKNSGILEDALRRDVKECLYFPFYKKGDLSFSRFKGIWRKSGLCAIQGLCTSQINRFQLQQSIFSCFLGLINDSSLLYRDYKTHDRLVEDDEDNDAEHCESSVNEQPQIAPINNVRDSELVECLLNIGVIYGLFCSYKTQVIPGREGHGEGTTDSTSRGKGMQKRKKKARIRRKKRKGVNSLVSGSGVSDSDTDPSLSDSSSYGSSCSSSSGGSYSSSSDPESDTEEVCGHIEGQPIRISIEKWTELLLATQRLAITRKLGQQAQRMMHELIKDGAFQIAAYCGPIGLGHCITALNLVGKPSRVRSLRVAETHEGAFIGNDITLFENGDCAAPKASATRVGDFTRMAALVNEVEDVIR